MSTTEATVTRTSTIPGPMPDRDSQPYWDALREHRLIVQGCAACARRRFPPTPSCPYCADPGFSWEEAAGTGTVYSHITVHRTFDEAFVNEVPYDIATVDLDGGARFLGRVEGGVVIGGRVKPLFVDHPHWTELRFLQADTP